MVKTSFGSWAFVLGPYASHPVSFEKSVRRIKEAGFDAVEICGVGGQVTQKAYPSKESRAQLKALLDDLGLERSGYLCDQTGWDPSEAENKQRYLERFSRHLELCKDLDVADIRVDTVAAPEKYRKEADRERALAQVAEVFQEAAETAAQSGVRLHWEFEPSFLFNKPSEIDALLARVPHPNFFVQFDTSHAYACAVAGARQSGAKETLEGGVMELLDRLAPRIGSLHLADGDGSLYHDTTSVHLPFGVGRLDWSALLARAVGLQGVRYWTVDLAFWPAAWSILEASRAFVAKRAPEPAAQA